MTYRTILVLAPHTDDAELGCGGMIARMLEAGANVFVTAFSSAEESLPEGVPKDTLKLEFYDAMKALGVPRENVTVRNYAVRRFSSSRQEILEEMIRLRRDLKPELVLVPTGGDVHQDHKTVHEEGFRAFKDGSVWGYELPWNHVRFSAQAFVELKREHIERKWEALQAYRSQFELERRYFSREFVFGLASVRGTQIRCDWAEAFEVLRVRV